MKKFCLPFAFDIRIAHGIWITSIDSLMIYWRCLPSIPSMGVLITSSARIESDSAGWIGSSPLKIMWTFHSRNHTVMPTTGYSCFSSYNYKLHIFQNNISPSFESIITPSFSPTNCWKGLGGRVDFDIMNVY